VKQQFNEEQAQGIGAMTECGEAPGASPRTFWLIVIAGALVGVGGFVKVGVMLYRAQQSLALTCAIVHRPKSGECPLGYLPEIKPRFTERDGSKQYACVSTDPAKAFCTDVLKSGESETLEFFVKPEDPPTAPEPDSYDPAPRKPAQHRL
jgi:hypothetical protein